MSLQIILTISVCLVWQINCQSFQPTELEQFYAQYKLIRGTFFHALGRNSEDPVNMRKARELNMLQNPVPITVPFPCNVSGHRSLKPPANVHQVRPGDIDIIAALGDSLTAGNGLVATDLLHVFVENRGLSWSIGGQGTWQQYITLPNILKVFNPNLFGYSLRDSLAVHRESQFNPAEPAAISSELPYMTTILIKRIKSDPRVNFKQHWKLITINIGSNDFCLDICYHPTKQHVLTKHKNDLISTLRLLRDNIPRVIVNIVPPPDVQLIKSYTKKPDICNLSHQFECFCFVATRFERKREELGDIIREWQRIDLEIASMPEFHLNDFTVIAQPFTLGVSVPTTTENKTDFSFLSQDCFHLSQKFNAAVANSLWNNMLERHGQKTAHVTQLFERFLCPTQDNPYIFTNKNSQL